jgi:hypothetical protein
MFLGTFWGIKERRLHNNFSKIELTMGSQTGHKDMFDLKPEVEEQLLSSLKNWSCRIPASVVQLVSMLDC